MSQSLAPTSSAASAAGGNPASQGALASLTSNFQTFLKMLMTQLQNQDPTTPMDSATFTTELVQFTGVEQQINTNSSLSQLIQLTQDNTVVQSSQLLGKQVQVTSSQLSLQNGSAGVDFVVPTAGPVAVAIYNSAGQQLFGATLSAAQGGNNWTWNGQTAPGVTAPDGVYSVAMASVAADGSTTALPFTITGTVTGVQSTGGSVKLDLGNLAVPMSAVVSVGN